MIIRVAFYALGYVFTSQEVRAFLELINLHDQFSSIVIHTNYLVSQGDFSNLGTKNDKILSLKAKHENDSNDCALSCAKTGKYDIFDSGTRRTFLQKICTTASTLGSGSLSLSSCEAVEKEAQIFNFEQVKYLSSNLLPFSTTRSYKTKTLSNGFRVLLVKDKNTLQSTVALTIREAGQFSDPDDLPGLAHLMEHMTLSSTNPRRRRGPLMQEESSQQDFDEWLADYDGTSNGFTAYDKVCFHFNCPNEVISEALSRFSILLRPETIQETCLNREAVSREIRRIDSEYNDMIDDDLSRDLFFIKGLCAPNSPNHPYCKMSTGNLKTLETFPKEKGVDVGKRLIEFFNYYYQPKNALLVVVSSCNLSSLEKWVAPFSSSLSSTNIIEKTRFISSYPMLFPKVNRPLTYCLYKTATSYSRNEKDLEKLSFHWELTNDYSDILLQRDLNDATATQIGFVISQVIGTRGPNSWYNLLKSKNWVPEGLQGLPRISFPADVSGFQLMKLDISLTLEGFASRSAVVASFYDCLNSLKDSNPLSNIPFQLQRELLSQYLTVAQLHGYLLSPRPPDAVELAVDGQLYGIEGQKGVGNHDWSRFPLPTDFAAVAKLQQALRLILLHIAEPNNAIVVATASDQAIFRSQKSVFDGALPKNSPRDWSTCPITGVKYYRDDIYGLSGRVNEWVAARMMEDKLVPVVLNPLIPSVLRAPRIPDKFWTTNPATAINEKESLPKYTPSFDPTISSSIVRDYWAILKVASHENFATRLQLPRSSPEPSIRCALILQLLSARPARAKLKSAVNAELWRISLQKALHDLAELGLPAGLAYEISFNKYGMRICFLGLSQNISSYARRMSRRIVQHQNNLLQARDKPSLSIIEEAEKTTQRVKLFSPQQRRQALSLIRQTSNNDIALEASAFFKSCSGGVCYTQGDLMPRESAILLANLKSIFRTVTGSNVTPVPAIPAVEEILYAAKWNPKSASTCAIAGAGFIADACGRIKR